MKRSRASWTLLLLLAAVSVAGQTKPRPTSYIESRQGNQPDGPDMIGHRTVSEGDTLLCMLVEVYEESHQSSTDCVIRFADGPKHRLAFKKSMLAPQDTEAYLECSGDKPRRCMIKVNPSIANVFQSALRSNFERIGVPYTNDFSAILWESLMCLFGGVCIALGLLGVFKVVRKKK
jgi:hypothetical protein